MQPGIKIIGAGPVGSYAANLMAEERDVMVFEEHPSIGIPSHCTGIVTPEIYSFISRNSRFIINKIHDVRIISPGGKSLALHFRNPDLILDRVAFDQHFYGKAVDSGAHIMLKHRFISAGKDSMVVKDLESKRMRKFRFSSLIGADGPNSAVGRSAGLLEGRKFLIGVQAIVKKKNSNVLDFYPIHKGFGWSVPEDGNTLRIGVASKGNPRIEFEHLLKRYGGKILERQGGLIPVYDPGASFSKGKISLAGDAAGFVKATTGGGLVPGLRSAELLSEAFLRKRDYQRMVRKEIKPSLVLNLKMRKVMDGFSDKEWDGLVQMLDRKRSKDAFQDISRDNLVKLLFSVLSANPKVIGLGFKHIKDLF